MCFCRKHYLIKFLGSDNCLATLGVDQFENHACLLHVRVRLEFSYIMFKNWLNFLKVEKYFKGSVVSERFL